MKVIIAVHLVVGLVVPGPTAIRSLAVARASAPHSGHALWPHRIAIIRSLSPPSDRKRPQRSLHRAIFRSATVIRRASSGVALRPDGVYRTAVSGCDPESIARARAIHSGSPDSHDAVSVALCWLPPWIFRPPRAVVGFSSRFLYALASSRPRSIHGCLTIDPGRSTPRKARARSSRRRARRASRTLGSTASPSTARPSSIAPPEVKQVAPLSHSGKDGTFSQDEDSIGLLTPDGNAVKKLQVETTAAFFLQGFSLLAIFSETLDIPFIVI